MWGLDPYGWLISVLIGSTTLIVGAILKCIPLENYLPGGGKEELSIEELDNPNSVALKRHHTR